MTPYIIAVAVLLPLLALMVSLYLWVQRHRSPDAARLKVLHGLLWFLFSVLLIWLASLIVFGGSGITSVESVLLPLSSILLVAASIAFQIRQCQRRLRQK
jgi:predicted metal-binding membrane protein